MKKIFTFIFLGACALSMNAQKQLPNNFFTNWGERITEMSGEEIKTIEAVDWISPNYITNAVTDGNWETGVNVCVTKGTEGDNSFVVIKNYPNTLLPGVIPSAINLGSLALTEDFSLSFGDGLSLAGNTEPIVNIKGKYKFDQKGTDVATIAIFGYNKVGGVNDTLMKGAIKVSSNVADWTEFTIEVKYRNNTPVVVEYVNVIAATIDLYHNDGNQIIIDFFGDYSEGTTLCIDDFNLNYTPVGVANIKDNANFRISVANNSLKIIETPNMNDSAIVSIFNIAGQMVYSGSLTNTTIDVSNLNRGTYMIQLSNNVGKYTQKFVK